MPGDELLVMSRNLKATRFGEQKAEEPMVIEHRGVLEKAKEMIVEYKESVGFKLGL